MNMNKESALVVFSGGQDSTTCLFWAKRNFKKVYALSFLYGQKHEKEVELAREIARKAEVEFDVMDVSFIGILTWVQSHDSSYRSGPSREYLGETFKEWFVSLSD